MPTALSERMKKQSGHYTTTSGVSSKKQIPVAKTLSGSLDKPAAHGHLSDQQEEEGEEQDDDDDDEEEEEKEEEEEEEEKEDEEEATDMFFQ